MGYERNITFIPSEGCTVDDDPQAFWFSQCIAYIRAGTGSNIIDPRPDPT